MRNFTTPWMNEKLQKLTTYIRGSQVFHTLEKKQGTGVTPFQHHNPLWGVAHTERGVAATSWICFISCISPWFLFEHPQNFPALFAPQWVAHSLPPDHSSDCWQLSWIQQLWMLGEKTLGKEAKLPFWGSLWEPLQVGCSCWHSRESGKIVVNTPGHGSCFMPSPTGCWWGQPRAGRDTCSTGIVPFFGLATERGEEKGGEQ